MIEPVGMLGCKYRIRGRVVIDNVDDAFHPFIMDGRHKILEVIDGPVLRIDRAIVFNRIGRAERAFAPDLARRMYREKIYYIGPKRAYPVEVLFDLLKRPFATVVPHEDLVHHHILKLFVCCFRHAFLLLNIDRSPVDPDAVIGKIIHDLIEDLVTVLHLL